MGAFSISKFRLLRHQKRVQKFFKSYHLTIIFASFTIFAFSNLDVGEEMPSNSHGRAIASAPPRQAIEIRTAYEKLSSANILHVTGTISSPVLSSDTVHYKWNKLENAEIISGNLEGDLDVSEDAQDVSLDVAVKNSEIPAQITLDASAFANGTKFSNEKVMILNIKKVTSRQ